MELTEQERNVIQLNRDYEQACREENAALTAAVEAIGTFFSAHRKRTALSDKRAETLLLAPPHRDRHVAENYLKSKADWTELDAWGRLMDMQLRTRHEAARAGGPPVPWALVAPPR